MVCSVREKPKANLHTLILCTVCHFQNSSPHPSRRPFPLPTCYQPLPVALRPQQHAPKIHKLLNFTAVIFRILLLSLVSAFRLSILLPILLSFTTCWPSHSWLPWDGSNQTCLLLEPTVIAICVHDYCSPNLNSKFPILVYLLHSGADWLFCGIWPSCIFWQTYYFTHGVISWEVIDIRTQGSAHSSV